MSYRIFMLESRQILQIFHWLLKAYPVLCFQSEPYITNNELPNLDPRKKTFLATLICCFTFTRFHANKHKSNFQCTVILFQIAR